MSGRIVTTDKSSCSDILKSLQSWVEDKSTVIVEGAHFITLSYCSVFLKEGELIFCADNGSPTESSSPPTEQEQGKDTNNPSANGAIIAVVIIALVLVIAVVVIIIGLVVLWKKSHSKKMRYFSWNT